MGNGHPCPHGAVKCANCGGSHGARADACAAKGEARLAARGWRSAPRERRERRAAGAGEAPEDRSPEVEAPVAQGGLGEAEVERGYEPAPEGVE